MQNSEKLRLDIVIQVGRQGKHHGLHHAHPGHGQADDGLFTFFPRRFVCLVRVVRRGRITRLPDFQQNVGEFYPAVVPLDAGLQRAVIQFGRQNTALPQ